MKTETLTKTISILDWVLVALAATISVTFAVECNFWAATWALIAGFFKLESIYRFGRYLWLENLLINRISTGKSSGNPERQEEGQEKTAPDPEDIPNDTKEND